MPAGRALPFRVVTDVEQFESPLDQDHVVDLRPVIGLVVGVDLGRRVAA